MLHITKNGHDATAIPAIKGAGIANRCADKRQLAALAAAVLEGDTAFTPSLRQLAQLFGVNSTYVTLARQFSPAKRKAIIAGEDTTTSFTALLHAPKTQLALPAPKVVTDEALKEIVRVAGISRTLDAAIAVETYAAH